MVRSAGPGDHLRTGAEHQTAYNVGQTKFGEAEDVIAQLYATSDREEQKKLIDNLTRFGSSMCR